MDNYDTILNCVKNSYKTCKQISEETKIEYIHVKRDLQRMRKRHDVLMIQIPNKGIKGVKPVAYKSVSY